MFLHLVHNNSRRSRRENGIYFVSLVVSVIAFYIILSLENQDVILFLKKMESDAVDKLLALIPVLYVITLFILFFLVFFAGKYQIERRNHEFAVYLMLGMKRTGLFAMLLFEEIWNSVLSLAAGIPAAIFLSELISLITARTVGLGIVGHQFTFSFQAVFWTVLGYFVIRIVALLLLGTGLMRKEIGSLLSHTGVEKNRKNGKAASQVWLAAGVLLLAGAYWLGISGRAWEGLVYMGATALLGIGGTFLLFYGAGGLLELAVKRWGSKKGLGIFDIRQLQESIVLQSKSLAVSSLLILMALCCFGYGITVAFVTTEEDVHVFDYTFKGDPAVIRSGLDKIGLTDQFKAFFEVKAGSYQGAEEDGSFSAESLIQLIEALPDSQDKEILLNHMEYFTSPYLISLSGYNKILELSGIEPLTLEENQAALYSDPDNSYGNIVDIMKNLLKQGAIVEMGGESFELSKRYCRENIVTDRSIHIMYGLVVADEVFDAYTHKDQYNSFWNAAFKDEIVEKEGLLQCISGSNVLLDQTGLEYESYLQNIGRRMFYMTASSYTTIYLAVIFLIIANTVMGVQFLMNQQKCQKRYRTLVTLGCHYRMLCRSARRQIKWYFALPVGVAVLGSMFGVMSLFSGFLVSDLKENISSLLAIAAAMIGLLCVVELLYVAAVMRISDRHLLEMMEERRDEG